jgi:hypothetical protein
MLSSRQVTAWFHTDGGDGWTPAQSLRDFLDLTLSISASLQFVVPLSVFRKLMCEALCTLYTATQQGACLSTPLRVPVIPAGWTEEHESLWHIYVEHELPDWETEANDVPVAAWESDLPNWRRVLASLFQYYIVREERLLIEADLLYVEEEEESA